MLSPEAYAPYEDPEQYIVEWTDKIWQSYGMGLIRDHYHPDITLHGAYGHNSDRESIIDGCLVKKTAFPHRAFTAEDVVWEERTASSWISSHRIINSGVQSGFWQYGPPSNRLSTSRNIALCLVRDAFIEEEWAVRDEWAVVEQNGLDVYAMARDLAAHPNPTILGSPDGEGLFGAPPKNPLVEGDSGPRPDNEPAACRMVLDFVDQAWNQRLLNIAPQYLHRSHVCYTSRYRTYCRAEGYQQSLGELIATFPDAKFEVRDVAANTDPFHGTRVSVMWRMRGTYGGAPTYGALTYSPVDVLGISHFVMRDGRIHNEYRVFDEIAVLTQIETARLQDAQ